MTSIQYLTPSNALELRGKPIRRLRLSRDLGDDWWAQGFDHGWRDQQRSVYAPSPSAKWELNDVEASTYTAGYLRGHGDARDGEPMAHVDEAGRPARTRPGHA